MGKPGIPTFTLYLSFILHYLISDRQRHLKFSSLSLNLKLPLIAVISLIDRHLYNKGQKLPMSASEDNHYTNEVNCQGCQCYILWNRSNVHVGTRWLSFKQWRLLQTTLQNQLRQWSTESTRDQDCLIMNTFCPCPFFLCINLELMSVSWKQTGCRHWIFFSCNSQCGHIE